MDDDVSSQLVDRMRDAADSASSSGTGDIAARQQELQMRRQVQMVQDTLQTNAFMPVVVSDTVVEGGSRIRPGVLQRYLDETVYTASNVNQLLEQADTFHRLLTTHSLAESAEQTLDARGVYRTALSSTQIPSHFHSNDAPHELSVLDVVHRLNVKPIGRFGAKTGTNVGNGEGDGYLQFQWRNILGGGERLTLDATKGTKTHSSYLLNFSAPVSTWWLGDLSIYKNATQLGGLELFSLGTRASLRSCFFGLGSWNHELHAEQLSCTTGSVNALASDSLLLQCGDDVKTSLSYTLSSDTRDSPVFASTGRLYRWANELALGSYAKTQFQLSDAVSWGTGGFFTMSTTVKAGYIKNLQPGLRPIHIRDKFHCGGANDVRGFQLMGLGPKDAQDSLGGDAFLTYGVSLFSRLPVQRWAASGFRLHWFVNGGRLLTHNNATLLDAGSALLEEHSVSCGTGLLFQHPVARFELNFALPLTMHSSDTARKGFQYGIGISFL
ncbi:AaceriAGR392Cp [[Ashbya] aceris (nom. inval.)]|nr:AaceriAGR392Cp [[Ashbya] aceris (nom. inval.)]